MSETIEIEIRVNGEPFVVPPRTSVAKLVELRGLAEALVAVEVNKDIVPRATHADTVLVQGDRVEIVTLVGGG